MEVINWLIDGLNGNAGAITGIATVVLVGITGYYAWVTKKILDDNRQTRLDAQKPEIAITVKQIDASQIASFDNSPSKYVARAHLYAENIGSGPAKDVKFTIDRDFRVPGHELLRNNDYVKHGIGYFQPRDIKVFYFTYSSADGYDELMQTPLDIEMTYKDSLHNEYPVCCHINFREHETQLNRIMHGGL